MPHSSDPPIDVVHGAARPAIAGGRIPVLDGVRGLAVVLVMFGHYSLALDPATAPGAVVEFAGRFGWIGVDLFFVLSGFLITGVLLDTKGGTGYFRNFFARRVLRIFPLYYGVLFGFFVLLPALFPGMFDALVSQQIWYWTYLTNLHNALGGAMPHNTAHFWSLAVEEQFYLIWPFVVYAAGPRRLKRVAVACIVLSLCLRIGFLVGGLGPRFGYTMTPLRLDGLAVGSLLAVIVREPGGLRALAPRAPPVLVSAGLLVLGIAAWRGTFHYLDAIVNSVGLLVVAVGFGALLVVALTCPADGAVRRLFTHPAARALGTYSYAIYIFHFPLMGIQSLGAWTTALPAPGGSRILQWLAFALVQGTASVALAWLSWHLYERNFLRLKRYFTAAPIKTVRAGPVAHAQLAAKPLGE